MAVTLKALQKLCGGYIAEVLVLDRWGVVYGAENAAGMPDNIELSHAGMLRGTLVATAHSGGDTAEPTDEQLAQLVALMTDHAPSSAEVH